MYNTTQNNQLTDLVGFTSLNSNFLHLSELASLALP